MSNIKHPEHYCKHPSGIECIQIVRHYGFDIGNAIKYLWRQGLKKEQGMDDIQKQIEDCEKAKWYITDHEDMIDPKFLYHERREDGKE